MAKINKYYFNVFNSYETYLMSIFVVVVVNLTRLNKDIKMQFVNFSLLKFSYCSFIPSSFLKIKRDFLRDHVFIYRFLFVYS
jgi:hypothetical protein